MKVAYSREKQARWIRSRRQSSSILDGQGAACHETTVAEGCASLLDSRARSRSRSFSRRRSAEPGGSALRISDTAGAVNEGIAARAAETAPNAALSAEFSARSCSTSVRHSSQRRFASSALANAASTSCARASSCLTCLQRVVS